MKFKKIISVLTTAALVATLGTTAFAQSIDKDTLKDLDESGYDSYSSTMDEGTYNHYETAEGTEGSASTVVLIEADVTNFKVTCPIALHFKMAADGTMTYTDSMATENGVAKIINQCPVGMVKISDVKVIANQEDTGEKPWKLDDFSAEFENKKANTKEFGFKINGYEVQKDGNLKSFSADDTHYVVTVKDSVANNDADKKFSDFDSVHVKNGSDEDITISGDLEKLKFPMIANDSCLPIYYEAKLPAQTQTLNQQVAGGVIFTVDFA